MLVIQIQASQDMTLPDESDQQLNTTASIPSFTQKKTSFSSSP
jgi:hypothetical protein